MKKKEQPKSSNQSTGVYWQFTPKTCTPGYSNTSSCFKTYQYPLNDVGDSGYYPQATSNFSGSHNPIPPSTVNTSKKPPTENELKAGREIMAILKKSGNPSPNC